MLPNFLILGASKCGTSSLYKYLQQHPQVYMPEYKEPHFLSYAGSLHKPFIAPRYHEYSFNVAVKTLTEYERLFAKRKSSEIALGEASTNYLAHPDQVIQAINDYLPDARLIAILRQPADRAYSAYQHRRRSGMQPSQTFGSICNAAFKRGALAQIAASSDVLYPEFYFRHGLYFSHLSEYFQVIPRNRIKVLLYDDLQSDPLKMLREIFSFLQVDDTFEPDTTKKHNQGETPRSEFLHGLLRPNKLAPKWLRWGLGIRRRFLLPLNLKKSPQFDPELRQELTTYYCEDILQLQDLIGRDLSHWLEPSKSGSAN